MPKKSGQIYEILHSNLFESHERNSNDLAILRLILVDIQGNHVGDEEKLVLYIRDRSTFARDLREFASQIEAS